MVGQTTGGQRGCFVLDIEDAAFITWDLAGAEMVARVWSLDRRYNETRQSYP